MNNSRACTGLVHKSGASTGRRLDPARPAKPQSDAMCAFSAESYLLMLPGLADRVYKPLAFNGERERCIAVSIAR